MRDWEDYKRPRRTWNCCRERGQIEIQKRRVLARNRLFDKAVSLVGKHTIDRVAELVVRLGLGEWVESRFV